MGKFAVKTLEFDKVKERLAAQASTSLGRELALSLQSDSNFARVKQMQEETAEALRLTDEGKSFPFGGSANINDSAKHAKIGMILDIEELMNVANTTAAMGYMKEFLATNQEEAPALAEYGASMQEFPRLVKQINSAIDEKGEVKDSASTKLAGLRSGILIAQRRVKEKLDSILHSPDYQKYFQDQLVTMREDRYVIPIKQEYKLNFPGVIHDQSGSGSTLFIEPLAVVNLNNDIKKYKAEEKVEVERILRQLSNNVGEAADGLVTTLAVFSQVDLICAKAYLARQEGAVRPMLLLQGKLEIVQGRHPLLHKNTAVPLDISLGENFTTLLITGPNTGGKTVALKTVGLFAMMAQAGLFLPASSVKLPVFGGVYADIGDEQSIEQSLSTFSGHMSNMVSILQEARSGDLVLVDEICVGTDPNEGAALAMSMLEYLFERKVLTIVTTHYSELKTFAYTHDGMENASVEFDPVTLKPTYRLLMGVPGSSNAFYISKRLGLPEDVLANAKNLLGREHANMENVLQNLDSERRQYEDRNRAIEDLRIEAEHLKNEFQKQKSDLDKRRNDILRKAREEADELYRTSRRETEAILKELRAMKKNADMAQIEAMAAKSRAGLNKSFALEGKERPDGKVLNVANAAVGQRVYLTTLGQTGVIDVIDGKQVSVRVGSMKTMVPMKNCILISQVESKKNSGSRRRSDQRHELFVAKVQAIMPEIDVRGKTVDEAIPYVDKAMDDAMLAGLDKIRVIHGKGTGMLRAGLTTYLQGNRFVKKIAIAEQSEGGTGATVVYLN